MTRSNLFYKRSSSGHLSAANGQRRNFFLSTANCQLPTLYCLLLTIVFATSCYTPRYVYSPSAHNVPVLLKKNDSKIAANYSANAGTARLNISDARSRGMDLQGAYAITNHFALQVSHYRRTELNNGNFDSNLQDSSVIRYHRQLTEFGAGYFKAFDDNKQAVFQVFIGAGFGKFRFTDDGKYQANNYYSHFHEAAVTKLYIQPALTVRNKRNFAASLSSRFSLINFHHIKTSYNSFEQDNYKLDSVGYSPHIFWEPAIIYTFGFKKVPGLMLEFQGGLALLQSRRFVDYRSLNFSAGLALDLPKLLKKRSAKTKKG